LAVELGLGHVASVGEPGGSLSRSHRERPRRSIIAR
jgi:hypothetical protein